MIPRVWAAMHGVVGEVIGRIVTVPRVAGDIAEDGEMGLDGEMVVDVEGPVRGVTLPEAIDVPVWCVVCFVLCGVW